MPARLPWFIILLSLSLFLFITGCAQSPTIRSDNPLLERSQAQLRAQRLSDVNYQFSIRLPADNVPFSGSALIDFNLSHTRTPLTVDFVDGEVLSVALDGKPIPIDYNGVFITLATEYLRKGQHRLQIDYRHNYRRDGTGLHWFKDPEDGETYIFSQFEAWDFNKVFPGFDQPDIKATFTLEVEAPAHWQVISATRETEVKSEASIASIGNLPRQRVSAPT